MSAHGGSGSSARTRNGENKRDGQEERDGKCVEAMKKAQGDLRIK